MSWRDELLPDEDPWARSSLRHVTGSAIVVHPPTKRVLLRWHERYRLWNHVGGHADDGEQDPFVTACREAREETGLTDLVPWPGPAPDVALVEVVRVPAAKGEPDHEHIDVCYVLATDDPGALVEEHDDAELRWLTLDDARALVNEHVAHLLDAVEQRFASS